jgi:hypothetical protein
MFVLMIAGHPLILSDARPTLAMTAGLGDRFHYWRGRSGRRYLFSVVPPESLDDFRSAIVLYAERDPRDRLAAREIVLLDANGRIAGRGGSWRPVVRQGIVTLVHFLAASDADRRRIADDLFPAASFSLAA